MKQCPKCSRTYANDKQKFCTKDGTGLVDAPSGASHDETVRIDSAQLDDEVTKYISRDLPSAAGGESAAGGVFDPYKTTVSAPRESTPPVQPSQPVAPKPAAPPPSPTPTGAATSSTESGTAAGGFDPFKTTIATPPEEKAAPPPPPSQPIAPPPAAAPPVNVTAPPAPPPVTPETPVTPPPTQAAPEPTPVTPPPAAPPTPPVNAAQAPPPTSMPATSAAAAAQTAPPVAPKKRSKLPLILGILFVLLLLGSGGLVAGYFFGLKPWLEKRRVAVLQPRRPEPTPVVVSTPDVGNTKPETPKIEVPPYSPPAEAVQFVNSSAKLDGKLAEHYVDFSFYYPKSWLKDPNAGVAGASNFAKVERRLPPDFTQENFAVGWYSSSGSEEGDRALFPTLAKNLSAQFAKAFGDYKKVSEGPTKAGAYDGYEFRFESASKNTEHGDIKIWGRVIFLPPPDGGDSGLTLLMLTTSLAPELKSVDDVGVKGQLPMLLESFRFGK